MNVTASIPQVSIAWERLLSPVRKMLHASVAARQDKANRLAAPYLLRLDDEALAILGHRRDDLIKMCAGSRNLNCI